MQERRPPREAQTGRQEQQKSQFSIMLANAIKEGTNPEVPKLKEEIDAVKKERSELIAKIKDTRRRLVYKESEAIAIAKLLNIEKGNEENNEKKRKIGYLKKMKNRLEFKISTEATSLAAEKDLVRRIEEINKELNDAYKLVRLERKSEFVKKDVEDCKAQLQQLEAKIAEMDGKLDELYDRLRKILGIKKQREEHGRPMQQRRPQAPPLPMQEINLEDIAVIKKKPKKEVASENQPA